MKRKPIIITVILCILIASGIWWYTKPVRKNHQQSLIAVQAVPVLRKDMPILLQTVGTIEPSQSVAITPQITGVIKSINFNEGQTVAAHQLLMTIDATSANLSLQQAQALLARDQAQLDLTSADAKRYAALVKLEYVTRQQYQQAVAAAAAQKAVVAADQDQVAQAQLQLSYSQIRAPIAGKTGSLNVKVGDLVTANSNTPLVIINQLNQLLVNFSLPQNDLSQVLNYQQNGSLQVQISSDNFSTLIPGKLTFIDNNINAQTGTVNLKATMTAQPLNLWPGQAVNVRLILAIQNNALVIPANAVQLDQMGNYVYVVQNGIAHLTRVTVDRRIDDWVVIKNGLQSQQMVLTQLPPNISDGAAVVVGNA